MSTWWLKFPDVNEDQWNQLSDPRTGHAICGFAFECGRELEEWRNVVNKLTAGTSEWYSLLHSNH